MVDRKPDELVNLIKATALNLRERGEFDTVHIFCTKHDFKKNDTMMYQKGIGNSLARTKQIEEYIKYNELMQEMEDTLTRNTDTDNDFDPNDFEDDE